MIFDKVILSNRAFTNEPESDSDSDFGDKDSDNEGSAKPVPSSGAYPNIGGPLQRVLPPPETGNSGGRQGLIRRNPPPVHDPCGILPYIRCDPHCEIKCEICSLGTDSDRILLCDGCDKGFHMFCLRPVVVNVPLGEWYCNDCRKLKTEVAEIFKKKMKQLLRPSKQMDVSKFLKTPFGTPKDFFTSEMLEFTNLLGSHAWLSHAKKLFTKSNNFFQVGKITQTIKEVRGINDAGAILPSLLTNNTTMTTTTTHHSLHTSPGCFLTRRGPSRAMLRV